MVLKCAKTKLPRVRLTECEQTLAIELNQTSVFPQIDQNCGVYKALPTPVYDTIEQSDNMCSWLEN